MRDSRVIKLFMVLVILGWSTYLGSGYGVFKFGLLLVIGLFLALRGVGVGGWWPFLLALGASWLAGVDHWEGWVGLYGEHENGILGWLVAILLANSGIAGKSEKAGISWGWGKLLVWCGFGVALDAWLQYFGINRVYGDWGRIYSTLGSSVYSGAFLGMCVVLAKGWLAPVFFLSGIWIMQSRGGLLGAAVGMLVLKVKDMRLLALIGVLAVACFFMFPHKSESDKGRILVWQAAIKGFLEKGITGWGPDSYYKIALRHRTSEWDKVYLDRSQGDAHNLFLQLLCTNGILGFFTFLKCFKLPKDQFSRSVVVAGLTSLMFNPISLSTKCVMFSFLDGEARASLWERRFLVCLLSLGCVFWGRIAAHDRLARLGNPQVWFNWQMESAIVLRVVREVEVSKIPLDNFPDRGYYTE